MVDVYQVVLGAIAVSTMILVPVGVVCSMAYFQVAGTPPSRTGEDHGARRPNGGATSGLCAGSGGCRWNRLPPIFAGCGACSPSMRIAHPGLEDGKEADRTGCLFRKAGTQFQLRRRSQFRLLLTVSNTNLAGLKHGQVNGIAVCWSQQPRPG
jgi:hypothetical protein